MADTPPAAAPLTHGRVWRIAGPIVLSNMTVPILGAVDTGVVGQMGEAVPIGAVGIGAIVLSSLYWIFGFLRMGTTGLAAQAVGAGERAETERILSRSLMIAFVAGGGLIVLQLPLFAAAFLIAPASAEVETLARDYLAIRIWSAPAAIAIYGITGWLIAVERTRAILIQQLAMNGLNIALNLWFVLGLGWGVEGVAIATVVAEVAGAALGLWFCRDAFRSGAWRDWARVFDGPKLKRMAAVNGDILIRSVLLQAVFVSFLFLGADLGDVPLAANQVLLQLVHFTAFALDGFAFGAETLVGQAMGARRRAALRLAAWLTSVWGAAVAGALSLAFAAGGPAIIDLMTTSPEVRGAARVFLPYVALVPVMSVAAFMLDGIFIGATRTRDMRNMMLVSALIYAASAAVLVPWLGNHGLWLALLISFAARGITLWLRYPALEAAAEPERRVA